MPEFRTYFLTWILLLFLTALTIFSASLNLGSFSVVVSLVIAGLKATLVLLYFMHLAREKRLVVRLIIPIVVIVLIVFIGLTYVDVITR